MIFLSSNYFYFQYHILRKLDTKSLLYDIRKIVVDLQVGQNFEKDGETSQTTCEDFEKSSEIRITEENIRIEKKKCCNGN